MKTTTHQPPATSRPALRTLHSALCTLLALRTPHSARRTLHSALCTLHSARRTLHSALCTLLSALCTLHAALCTLLALCTPHSALSAVPIRWTVETTRATPAAFEGYQGETIDFEAALNAAGKPLAIAGDAALYWQTNGMGAAYWSAPASVTGNVLRATWTPACDVGARAYNCFIGVPGAIYRAAFQLRLRPSPGATPNALPLPQRTLDFSQITVLNPPWPTNAVGVRDMTNLTYVTGSEPGWISLPPGATNAHVTAWEDGGYVWQFEPNIGDFPFVGFSDENYGTWPTEEAAWAAAEVFEHFYSLDWYYRSPGQVRDRIALVSEATNIAESVAQALLNPLADRVDAAEGTIAAWEHYWDGDDVRFTVTNYFGNLDLPALYIEQKMEPDATHTGDWFKVVWDERTRLAPITNRLTQAEAAIDALDAGKADNGTWGYYDSHAGTVAPEGFVSISAGGVILGNGQTWQKTLVAEGGEVWTLVGSATVAPGTNGVLRLEDTDGTTVFEVVKGGRVTRGATAAAIAVGNAVTITYTLSDAQENPTIQYCTDLVTHDWQTLSADTSTTPHVAWSHEGDTYTATVTLPSPRPERMFFKASYEAGEDGYVKFHSPVDATPGLYVRQGNTRVKIVPVLSGTTSGSTVTWKVE